jgi:hypothetical protein
VPTAEIIKKAQNLNDLPPLHPASFHADCPMREFFTQDA